MHLPWIYCEHLIAGFKLEIKKNFVEPSQGPHISAEVKRSHTQQAESSHCCSIFDALKQQGDLVEQSFIKTQSKCVVAVKLGQEQSSIPTFLIYQFYFYFSIIVI